MTPRFHQPDSLEMLLDTLCNAFGGIILIALLVTLIAREAQRTEAATRQGEQDPGLLERRLSRAEDDLNREEAYRDDLMRQRADPQLAARLRLVEEREFMRRTLEAMQDQGQDAAQRLASRSASAAAELQDQLQTLLARQETLNRDWTEEQNRHQTLEAAATEARDRAAHAETELRSLAERQTRRLRLPREHDTARKPWHFIARHGRLYPVHLLIGGHKERNTGSILWHAAPDGNELLEPRPEVGLDPAAAGASLGSLFAAIPRDQFYLIFHVYEDSFAAFIRARDAAVSRGFEMTWVPLEKDTQLILRPWTDEAPPRPL